MPFSYSFINLLKILHESRPARAAFVFGGIMLKSCTYCGKTHGYNEICPKKAEYRKKYNNNNYKRESAADRFRNSRIWREKRDAIQRRDCYMCRCCFCIDKRITTSGLSVHHIVPINNNYELRLQDSNLITLCRLHHEQAEKGMIKADVLRSLLTQPLKL